MLFKRPSPLRAASSDGGSSHPAERRVHCTALPETLVESTLFGHDREAFTGMEESKFRNRFPRSADTVKRWNSSICRN